MSGPLILVGLTLLAIFPASILSGCSRAREDQAAAGRATENV